MKTFPIKTRAKLGFSLQTKTTRFTVNGEERKKTRAAFCLSFPNANGANVTLTLPVSPRELKKLNKTLQTEFG